ncbi:efflux RND transporter periplasmic adaptor subunit [Acinetobacter radioresistens]|uniref:efflux RND transporter periplasmic adaptor subunit n=1 Tax=Acinetobacter radioresistens TaxID=40216 RepID=UPI000946501A|nr:efflux RND transporter periplasmic adaptor subunit [Acinetobacter radioresistens]
MKNFQKQVSALILTSLLIVGCGGQTEEAAFEYPPAIVSVYEVKKQPIQLIENLPGRVAAYRTAEIRPQVAGIIEKVLFQQGSKVKAGQALFRINSDLLYADVKSNQAALTRAQAEVKRLFELKNKYAELLPSHAISQQEFKNTEAAYHQALADVAQMQATLERQSLTLKYSIVTAPISGRIGQMLVTEGALVSQADPQALAVIQQLDRVYVDVKQSMSDFEKLQAALKQGELSASDNIVDILNTQGKSYNVQGKILFSDTQVDPDTGDVLIRIVVDNPAKKLLPGMYVRVNLNRAQVNDAILVPEQAIQRDPSGQAQVSVVNAQGQVEVKILELGQRYDHSYVVLSGLQQGEKVIVEGADRIMPEQPITVKPWQATPNEANKGES